MDKELIKNIVNCSRCGLCMDVCPVYKAKKTETSVSRGKFLQLLGLIKKQLKFDKRIKYNLDLCLNCKKCKAACPSDIDAVKIFAEIKNEFQTPFEKFLNSPLVFKIKMFSLWALYKVKYPFKRSYYKKIKKGETSFNIAHFNGCATKSINNKFELPYKFKEENFDCCGLPFFVKGRIDVYEKYKKRNLRRFEKFDKIVFDCATCYDTVLNYEGVNREKIVYFTDFYKNKKLRAIKPFKITFHKPCHLDMNKFLEIEEILSHIEKLSYKRLNKFDDCCGFGGDFFTRHIKTATILSKEKIQNVLKTNSDTVLTTCPTCLWSLKYGIKLEGAKIKAFDLADFLHNFVEIIED